jgi:aminopeptidase-like protein
MRITAPAWPALFSQSSEISTPVTNGGRQDVGAAMHALITDLYPLCRSITGDGLRETLRRLQALIPLKIHEVPSGTPVLDWIVPNEWNIRDAYVKNSRGERIVDFQDSNLHVLNYSVPVRRTVTLAELRAHCFSLPEHPDWIPYRTSYYQEAWGFCLPHRQLERLPDDTYEVCIDATLAPGHLSYGELVVFGETIDEILVSCHSCHPSLCNDNLSGVAVATYLARQLLARKQRPRHTYRFLFIPGTIGSITWLARNEAVVPRIKHGVVLASVGDAGGDLHYKRSRRGDAVIDRAVAHVLRTSGERFELLDFTPYGYDERQYCSPGYDLAVGCLSRTPHSRYPEYHTSADNLDFVSAAALADSYATCLAVFDVLDGNDSYRNRNPKGEPQLGRRGLYQAIGGPEAGATELALLWVLNQSDGNHSLLDIAERAGLPFWEIRRAADLLLTHGLLGEKEDV